MKVALPFKWVAIIRKASLARLPLSKEVPGSASSMKGALGIETSAVGLGELEVGLPCGPVLLPQEEMRAIDKSPIMRATIPRFNRRLSALL